MAGEGWAVTAGRCPEHEGAPAGWAWAQALRRLARAAPPADPQALATLLTDTPQQDGDAAAARFRLHRAVAGYLEEVSRAAPLLVMLDDLHRADDETLAILADVIADLTGQDPGAPPTGPPRLTSNWGCLAAWLPASRPGSRCRAGRGRGGRTDPGDLHPHRRRRHRRAIAERTGGNPFFIRETARLLDSEGALAATTEVPAGVREVLQRRIARLPATAQTILRQASVIGTETDADVLGDVADVEERAARRNRGRAAHRAGDRAWTRPDPVRARPGPRHPLPRPVPAAPLPAACPGRRGDRTAQPWPGGGAGLPFRRGRHRPGKGQVLPLAAGQDEQRFAYREAARLWEQAIACLDQADDTPARDRIELVLCLVRALSHAGELPRARSWRQDAIRAALLLDDPVLLARVITAFDVPRAYFFREHGETDYELVGRSSRRWPGCHPAISRCAAACLLR